MNAKFDDIFSMMVSKYPAYAPLWASSREEFGKDWETEFCENFSRVFGPTRSEKWDAAINGYAEFCTDALRAQIFFEKNDRYKANNYEDVFKNCYSSPDYMVRRYLPGQYISHSIWPHHQRMFRHYKSVLGEISQDVKLFYEVGVGCGLYSQETLKQNPSIRGVGFDISQHSLDFTMNVARVHGLEDRYSIRRQDVIKQPPETKADLVLSQEVLEHLEDPLLFVEALRNMVRPGGWGYITAAINAAHTDHIYLYRSPSEVQDHIERAGWKVMGTHIEQAYPEKPEKFRPTIAAYLARRD